MYGGRRQAALDILEALFADAEHVLPCEFWLFLENRDADSSDIRSAKPISSRQSIDISGLVTASWIWRSGQQFNSSVTSTANRRADILFLAE